MSFFSVTPQLANSPTPSTAVFADTVSFVNIPTNTLRRSPALPQLEPLTPLRSSGPQITQIHTTNTSPSTPPSSTPQPANSPHPSAAVFAGAVSFIHIPTNTVHNFPTLPHLEQLAPLCSSGPQITQIHTTNTSPSTPKSDGKSSPSRISSIGISCLLPPLSTPPPSSSSY